MARACELTGQRVVIGRNVSHTKGHPTRVSRKFIPNLKNVTFKSGALGCSVTLKVATKTIRTINKYGGFDSFLVNYRNNKLTDFAKTLKRKIEKILIKDGQFDSVKIVKEKVKKTFENARKVKKNGNIEK